MIKLNKIILISTLLILSSLIVGCGNKSEAIDAYVSQDQETLYQKPQSEQDISKPQQPPEDVVTTAKISVTGDIMVHSYQYEEAYDPNTGTYDFMHNFTEIKKYFADSDIVLGNLETTFAGEDVGISDYPCFNTPDSFADALKDAGFNILTTANNHCMDKGQAGLLRTLEILDQKGIDHFGTYATQQDRDNILIKDVNGIKIAFLSYTYGTNGIPVKESYNVNIMDEELIVSDIKKAKEQADFVIVMPHMGNEYELYVRDVFKDWVNLMFDAGADLVLASHPHVLQPMKYKKITDENGNTRTGFVIYSLGNFISSQTTPPRNAGVILNIEIEKTNDEKPIIKEVAAIPIWTQFRNVNDVNDFKVRAVYDLLTLSEQQLKETIRLKDISRIYEIQKESTQMLLGYEVPVEQIQSEYIFEQTEENFE